jgi:hypothetical protein
MTRRGEKVEEVAAVEDVTSTAARIAAMLDRWEAEDVSDEPDWDIADIEPLALHAQERARRGSGTTS